MDVSTDASIQRQMSTVRNSRHLADLRTIAVNNAAISHKEVSGRRNRQRGRPVGRRGGGSSTIITGCTWQSPADFTFVGDSPDSTWDHVERLIVNHDAIRISSLPEPNNARAIGNSDRMVQRQSSAGNALYNRRNRCNPIDHKCDGITASNIDRAGGKRRRSAR